MNPKSKTALCIAALLAVNAWILARLFKTEYTPFMSSIEGAYVGISRWMIAHGIHARWFPLWYDGIPSQNSYPPLLHSLVALWSWATGMTVAHSHHFVSGAFYCLAPVGLFLLTLRLTRSRWKSFIAGALYSLVSPSAFLLATVRHDAGSAWGARKIQALIVYGEGPHVTSIALLFFALAAISAALEYELGWWTVAAIVASSLVALTNWLGAMSLALGGVAMLLASRKNRLGRLALIGALAYGLAMPWIPPSDLAAVRMNAQLVGGFPMGTPQYVYLVLWFAAAGAICLALRKIGMSEGVSFAVLFLFFMAVPPLGYEWFHAYPLPQPDRYHLEMDGAFAIVGGILLGSRRLLTGPAWKRIAVPVFLCALALVQAPRWRKQVHNFLPAFDVTKTVEREQALWLQSHFPGQRVFVEGSTRFWFNAFADNPQLGGGFDQGRTNRAIADVAFAVPYLKGNGADSVALLKAYGVRALAVAGKNSRDAYRDYSDPGKFSGVIPERWRDGDDVIYEIPGDGSLVHVVPTDALITTGPLDWPAINRFAAAIDHSPLTTAKWDGTDRASISTRLASADVLSVQISWDPGWRASVNGADLPIGRDKLGLMVLRPSCENGCTIDLAYTGGTEARVAEVVFTAALLLCGFVVFRGRNNAPHPAPDVPAAAFPYPLYFRALRASLRWLNKKLPPWPIADNEEPFDRDRLRAADAALRGMKMADADGDRYLAKHIPRLSKTLALVPPPQSTGRVLELGCYGQITPLLERHCGYREVRGAYYGPQGKIDRKTHDFPDGRFSCWVDHFDVERHEFPYPDNYFDLVIGAEMIEHMTHDPMWMLLESRRVLADGGYLLLSTPNVGSITSVAKTLQGRDNPQIFFKYERPDAEGKSEIGHVREYTAHELGEAVKAAGFEVERLFTTFIAEFLGHEQLLRLLALNDFSTENRGEQTWCLARKNAALPVERYPFFLYEP